MAKKKVTVLAEELLGGFLEKEGYETERFSACSDSRRALEQTQPDLILLDWNLPDGDGLCFAVKYQKSGKSPY